jgi:hypothetical protein
VGLARQQLDATAQGLHDPLRDVEAEPGSFTGRLGGEERVGRPSLRGSDPRAWLSQCSRGQGFLVGVKVFGDDPRRIQSAANDIAAVLREVPGAVDVFPDQIAGRNPEA